MVAIVHSKVGSQRRSSSLDVLSDALASLSAERSLSAVLQRIPDLAREVVGARYAALGVTDTEGRITDFVTSGLTPEERAAIGPLPRGYGLLGVLIREGEPFRIPDISRDPRSAGFPPHHPPMTSLLGIPISLDGRMLGSLYLTDKLDGADFDESDERLALLLARHAAIAIENARLNDEHERQLEEVSALRTFGQVIGQQLDTERTMQIVVERSLALLGASLVAIAIKDPSSDMLTFEAAAGRRARRLLRLPVSMTKSMVGWIAAHGHGAIVDDVAHDPRVSLPILEAVGGKAGLWAPLKIGHRVLGCLMAIDPVAGGSFGQADLRLAEGIGQQAAVAIDNARLYERARREASTSSALLRITRAMNASIHLEEILQLIVDSLADLIGTPAVAVSLLAADGSHLELAATRALAHQGGNGASSGRVGSLAPLVVGWECASLVADTRERSDLTFPVLRDGSTPRSVAISPIRIGARVLGVVEAYSTEVGHFDEDDAALLAAFADQAATAIETARLFGQARELVLVQERNRIAKELHDGIIQTIYAVGLNLDYCRLALRETPDDVEARLGEATAGLNQAMTDIRAYVLDLMHRDGSQADLRDTAEALAREYSRPTVPGQPPVTVTVDVSDTAATPLTSEQRSEIFQILREALANASRHAQASAVQISARVEAGRLVLAVTDDGVGFDLTIGTAESHHGMRNMANRARMLDADLEIRSALGQGTTIELAVRLLA